MSTNTFPPFFVVACARSGTSLLRRMLSNHSAIAIPTESLFMIDYLRVQHRFPLPVLVRMLVKEPEIAEWGITPVPRDFADCNSMVEVLHRLHEIYVVAHHKRSWGQKTPRFIRSLDLLSENFPRARFVHIIRDPRAVANSLILSNVHRSTAYYAARRWLRDVAAGLEFERAQSEVMLRIYYEDLVSRPVDVLLTVCEHLRIAYEPAMLAVPQDGARQEYSSFYQGVHKNLQRSTTGQFADTWKAQMPERDVLAVESLCSALMLDLGYHPQFPAVRSRVRSGAPSLQRLPGLLLQLGRYLRYRRRYGRYLLWRKWRLGLLAGFVGELNA